MSIHNSSDETRGAIIRADTLGPLVQEHLHNRGVVIVAGQGQGCRAAIHFGVKVGCALQEPSHPLCITFPGIVHERGHPFRSALVLHSVPNLFIPPERLVGLEYIVDVVALVGEARDYAEECVFVWKACHDCKRSG